MSVFSVIKRGRQQAKEQAQKLKELKEKEAQQPVYKHVPTHAAQDALAGAPPTWRMEDRPRVLEQNRRRSAMAASGMNMNMPGPSPGPNLGSPRASSALSNVMYPTAYANPMVGMSRSYSDYGGTPRWPYRGGEVVVYSTPDSPCIPNMPGTSSPKGKDVDRALMFEAMRVSSLMDKGSTSVSSSDYSTSSQDEPDLKSPRPVYGAQQRGVSEGSSGRSPANSTNEFAGVHRLHPSRSRRSSDASERRSIKSGSQAQSSHSHPQASPKDSRPPLSMRGFNAIPAQASYMTPPMQLPGNLTRPPPNVASSTASTINATEPSMALSHQSQATGASSPTSSTSSPTRVTQHAQKPPTTNEFVFPFAATTGPDPAPKAASAAVSPESAPRPAPTRASTQPARTPSNGGSLEAAPAPKHRDRRVSRAPRFNELETIESNTSSSFSAMSAPARPALSREYSAPPQIPHEVISQAFEQQAQREPEPVAEDRTRLDGSKSKGKLTKSRPAKLSKRNRWSTNGNQAVMAS